MSMTCTRAAHVVCTFSPTGLLTLFTSSLKIRLKANHGLIEDIKWISRLATNKPLPETSRLFVIIVITMRRLQAPCHRDPGKSRLISSLHRRLRQGQALCRNLQVAPLSPARLWGR